MWRPYPATIGAPVDMYVFPMLWYKFIMSDISIANHYDYKLLQEYNILLPRSCLKRITKLKK